MTLIVLPPEKSYRNSKCKNLVNTSTVNSQQSTINSQQSTINSQQSTVNRQPSTI
ncbi:hypothetical protein H6G33_27175 [Calothrix sp. FACHB-1219]|uniref:hypothetical protein n=1 Tax=unclassified Calothrix TaxID=2619626 RepID=UPI001986818A|nr:MULTISPECIES: hypothetical protein [unclassified Calothrix]MBD2205862.1 hypothetical protein [Calothrix sp. FACHB-168]MBD2220691.1 hypothetical protein [Calothrix sp. FACHB-1219]